MSHTFTPLPSLRSPLFGREQACVQLVDMLQGGCPLVTVTGAGGVGKTSVALAVGQRLLDAFDQRVVFVELADVDDPGDVASVIVSALRLPVNSDRTLESTLSNALGFRRTLLILDNMEHVRGAAPLVGRLLEQAPLLSVLVTSRVAIGSSLENVFALVPLPCDAPTAAAIELFAAHAASSSGGFVLDERNIASVMELCRRLDGLPLAIELAASRMAMLEPAALLERLRRPTTGDAVGAGGLLVLRGIEHDRHPRHRALTTTIEWSVQLLEPAHRDLLDALAVFDGGWTLDSAEAVWGTVSADEFAAFEGVNALLRHHLIMREPATEVGALPANSAIGGPRYRMLETIRQYVIEHGINPDRAELWNDRHAWCFVELATRARGGLESADETSWTSLLESEDANIRSALHHLDRTGQANGLLRLTSALGRHWRNSGRWNHGQSWLGVALEQSAGSNPPAALLADAQAWRGRLAIESGVVGETRKGSAEAIDDVDAALALAYEVDDPRVLLRCIEAALAAHSTSDVADQRARALCVRGISLSVELGDRWWQAMLESWRGVQLRVDGDLMGAELASTSCRALARADGNRHMAGLGGWVLSSVLIELRRADEAAAVLRVAIEDNMSAGDRRSAAFCHLSLGTIQLLRNELVGAAEHLRDGLLLAQESSDWVGAGFGLIGFVSLASRSGNHGHAARILGGLTPDVDALCRMHPSQRRSLDRAVASASDALGPEMFERIVEQAAQLGWREATLDALDVAELVLAAPHQTERSGGEPTAAVENPNRLTTREIEVLRLIAEGCTNNEVGDRLFVSVGTVERHIANLYRKIGARRRADATVYAVRNGFLST